MVSLEIDKIDARQTWDFDFDAMHIIAINSSSMFPVNKSISGSLNNAILSMSSYLETGMQQYVKRYSVFQVLSWNATAQQKSLRCTQ